VRESIKLTGRGRYPWIVDADDISRRRSTALTLAFDTPPFSVPTVCTTLIHALEATGPHDSPLFATCIFLRAVIRKPKGVLRYTTEMCMRLALKAVQPTPSHSALASKRHTEVYRDRTSPLEFKVSHKS
jgi:hypothetical protein